MLGDRPTSARHPIPFHLLTGFLGSGKTTVLRELLTDHPEPIAVLVNEVGELGLDHHLLERIDEDLLLLPGGCVCCEIRGELHAAIERVVAREPARIVLETTGLADPAPLLHTLGSDPRMKAAIRLAGVIVVVDALRIDDLLATQPEAARQLDFADRVVLTKTDIAPQGIEALKDQLEAQAPGRELRVADHGRVDAGWLMAEAGFGGAQAADRLRAWLAIAPAPESGDHAGFSSFSVRHDEPVDPDPLMLWLRLVTQVDGPRLLRIKAMIRSAQDGQAYVLQSAGRSVSPPLRMKAIPKGLTGAEVVVIERGLSVTALEALQDSLQSALRGR
ncbi:MAG: GTP-binding protein [Planctomycetes bacterium]|nr:GTP-binding protein [Planctomycetota bacterium]